jgi:hypothetical protein
MSDERPVMFGEWSSCRRAGVEPTGVWSTNFSLHAAKNARSSLAHKQTKVCTPYALLPALCHHAQKNPDTFRAPATLCSDVEEIAMRKNK